MTARQAAILAALQPLEHLDHAAAAAALSTPTLQPVGRVTFTTMAARLGAPTVCSLINLLDELAAGTSYLRGLAKLANAVLGNDGLDPLNAESAAAVQELVNANVISAADARRAQFDEVFPCGSPVSATEVGEVRGLAARASAVEALEAKVFAAAARFVNEVLRPAANAGAVLPTWQDFRAAVAAEQ